MNIKGAEGLTEYQLMNELKNGGKLVVYQYAASPIYVSLKNHSKTYLIRYGESAFKKGVKYSLFSFVLGWWGFPFGPIYTIASIVTNCKGGIDITQEYIDSVQYPEVN